MARKTVTRCSAEVGLSAYEYKVLVEQALDQITDCLARGEAVKLFGLADPQCGKRGRASAAIRGWVNQPRSLHGVCSRSDRSAVLKDKINPSRPGHGAYRPAAISLSEAASRLSAVSAFFMVVAHSQHPRSNASLPMISNEPRRAETIPSVSSWPIAIPRVVRCTPNMSAIAACVKYMRPSLPLRSCSS